MSAEQREKPRVTRETIEGDPELASLLQEAGNILGEVGLTRLLIAQQRFNEPVHFFEDDRVDNFYKLKEVLKEIPGYVDLSERVCLSPIQTENTLVQLFDASPYDFHDHGMTIYLLKRAFQSMNEIGQTYNLRSYEVLTSFINTCSKEGIIDGGFFGLALLASQRVEPVPAMKTIKHLADADGSLAGYTIGPFLDLLRATSRSGIKPHLLTKTLAAIGGKRPYYRQNVYVYFQEALAFGCPLAGVTPSEMLKAYFNRNNQEKDIAKFISRYLGDTANRLPEYTGPIIITDKDKEHYFVPTEGRLEHSANPYRTRRKFMDGVHDLLRLASVDSGHWDALSEGMFIFDPKKNTWYCLGGKSELARTSVIHNVIYYDLGQLSDEPSIFVVHPKGFESWIQPNFEEGTVLNDYKRQIATFLGGTPGRGEYTYLAHSIASATRQVNARYFIVHSAGMTEVLYPNDTAQLDEMGTAGRQIRDEALLTMDWQKLVRTYGYEADASIVFSWLLTELNRQLPEGFSMTYYPSPDSFEPRKLPNVL